MELDNIKVVKKTKTVKKNVKQIDDPELEEIKHQLIQDEVDKLINAIPKKAKKKIVNDSEQEEAIDNEEQPVKKVIKKIVKKAKQEDPDEINNHKYCFDKKIITAALLKKKNNTFYVDYVKDKPFNLEWVEFVLGILSEHTIEDFTILNHLFENAKEGQYVNNINIISKIIKDNVDYYENHGNNWVEKYINKYQWLRTNINNGFKVTSELISNIRKYFTIYDELTLVHFKKTTSREPWQNQKFIEKLYKSESIIIKMFIDKHLTTEKNKQKFINLSEAYFKKDDNNFNNKINLGIYVQFMLSQSNYYNEYIMILFLRNFENIYNFLILEKKYFPQDISMDVINSFMKKNNKIIDLNIINKITKEYNCNLEERDIYYLLNDIYKYKFTEFKKLNIQELLKIYKIASNEDKIEKLEYFYDGKFTEEDYYSLILMYSFTSKLLENYGEKILKNNELSKKIFNNALNVDNEIIVEYFLNNKYNVTDEDILNTKSNEILLLYKEHNIFMTKDVLYKYYRKYYNNHILDNLIHFTEYHNHPEDFKEIQKEIELTEFEELICNTENTYMLILELEKQPIVTLDMIVYLANDENKNILYDYYLKQNQK